MNKIEKKDILPEVNELAKLKQEILKQAPQASQPEKKNMDRNNKSIKEDAELAQKENADKALEAKLNEPESKLENLSANEVGSEASAEKTPPQTTKIIHTKSRDITKADLNLPSDAPVMANNNRIKEANTTLQTMLSATGIGGWIFKKLFGFSESDKIPENLA